MLNDLANILIDASGRYHLFNGKPLYLPVFNKVLKFHPPGLAAVEDDTGAFHIELGGKAIYTQRYKSTYGFYCDRAAVMDHNGNCFHIDPDGKSSYTDRYTWCGNFQENKCVVKNFDDMFFHINTDGNPIYNERYLYVGDYKDGIAVVKRAQDGKSTHINTRGIYIHNKWYEDLDVFHKGYARARSKEGWFHVDLNGQSLYSHRYKYLEPFYNNVAYAITHDDDHVLISEAGDIIQYLYTPVVQEKNGVDIISGQITAYWNSFALMYFIQLDIVKQLPCSLNDLAVRTGIPFENLKRLISVVAEIGYVKLELETITATPRGETIKQRSFIKDAVNIWSYLSKVWGDGLCLLKAIKGSFPDFKSSESNLEITRCYQNALLGYATHECPSYETFRAHLNPEHTKILMAGRQGLAWADAFYAKDSSISFEAYVPRWVSEPLDNQRYKFPVHCLDNVQKLPKKKFDAIVFVKLMMHYDDNIVQYILCEIKEHLNITGEIYIIEPVIGVNGSLSELNLNMLFECGGKLRTLDEWQKLLMNLNLYITKSETIGNNTLLRISKILEDVNEQSKRAV
jgi:hypothetical protein